MKNKNKKKKIVYTQKKGKWKIIDTFFDKFYGYEGEGRTIIKLMKKQKNR